MFRYAPTEETFAHVEALPLPLTSITRPSVSPHKGRKQNGYKGSKIDYAFDNLLETFSSVNK
jgi:hypothetical protein